MPTSKRQIAVVCDNGGGVTLMVNSPKYAHYYGNAHARQCANDLIELRAGGTPSDWEGNEADAWMRYDDNVVRNGGYRWYEGNPQEVIDDIGEASKDTSWRNVTELAAGLRV